MTLPRGMRNKNPMNLVKTKINWIGKVEKSTDRTFEQFTRMEYGIRAGAMDIANDIRKGKNTVEKLIEEFAPSSENNTKAYIRNVCKRIGVQEWEVLEVKEKLIVEIVRVIIDHENGTRGKLISNETIKKGVEMLNLNKQA